MKLKKIISNLSLEEKVSLLSGFDNWHTQDIKKHGIPKIKMSDGPNGVRRTSTSLKRASSPVAEPIFLINFSFQVAPKRIGLGKQAEV